MIDLPLFPLILVSISVILFVAVFYFRTLKSKKPFYALSKENLKGCELLFDALKECHFSNHHEYLAKIRELARIHPDEPVFFLFAGDIARKTDPGKALEIHRDILFRPSTEGKFRALVLKHIAEDYIALKQNEKAKSVLKDAVKTSNFPAASKLLSKIFESEGNYDDAYIEMEKYITGSNILEKTLLKRLSARAAHFNIKSDQNAKAVQWLEKIAKLSEAPNEVKIIDFASALLKAKKKKAGIFLKAVSESGESYELLCRSMLLGNENCQEINQSADGKYMEPFKVLFEKGQIKEEWEQLIDRKSVFFGKLLSFNVNDERAENFLAQTMTDDSLFICSECGGKILVKSPVCPACQKITGRKLKILPEA